MFMIWQQIGYTYQNDNVLKLITYCHGNTLGNNEQVMRQIEIGNLKLYQITNRNQNGLII